MSRISTSIHWLPVLLMMSLVTLVAACGASEGRSLAIEISGARWSGESVIVDGSWMKGLSTPPACRLLESRDGEVIGRFSLEGASFDGNTFSQEIVPDKGSAAADAGYHVRCTVALDSAKTASDIAPVEVPG